MNLDGAYTAYGDPSRPTLLFLHGIRLGREIWVRHAQALAHDYHVVTLDLPGHGALANVPFTEEAIRMLMEEVMTRVVPSPPIIVGYSLGGYVAMEYAAKNPSRTRALLLAGCTLDFESWKRWPFELSARLSRALPEALLAAMMRFSLRMTLPRAWADIVVPIAFNQDVFEQTNSITHEFKRFSDKIARYPQPVLFVNGEYDLAFRLDERRFLHRLPQARLRIIRGVEHTAPMRRVEEFTAIVNDFAKRTFAQGTAV